VPPRARDLLTASRDELAALLREGHGIRAEALDDTEYRGISLGLPGFVDRLTWKTFRKTFHRDPDTGLLRGWNVRLEQGGLDAPSVPMRRGGRPVTFGHYVVVAGDPGLLLDYSAGQNGLSPTALVRDPVVALEPGDPRLLLGWTYLQVGRHRIGTPSYFVLELEGPLSFRVPMGR
jgi:hypothetical protein